MLVLLMSSLSPVPYRQSAAVSARRKPNVKASVFVASRLNQFPSANWKDSLLTGLERTITRLLKLVNLTARRLLLSVPARQV